MKEKLLAYGFQITEEEPEKIYIDQAFIRGLETISESDVITNHNELHSGVKENWLKFKAEFPEIKSAM